MVHFENSEVSFVAKSGFDVASPRAFKKDCKFRLVPKSFSGALWMSLFTPVTHRLLSGNSKCP